MNKHSTNFKPQLKKPSSKTYFLTYETIPLMFHQKLSFHEKLYAETICGKTFE